MKHLPAIDGLRDAEIDALRLRILSGERTFSCRISSQALEELRAMALGQGLRVLVIAEADGWADVEVEDGNYTAWGRTLQ